MRDWVHQPSQGRALTACWRTGLLVLCGSLPALAFGGAPEPFSTDQVQFFESRIRPVLIERCQKCHGSEEQHGGLRLDRRDELLHGGESGVVVEPGAAAASLLIRALKYDGLEMPPDGRLSVEQIRDFEAWINSGVPWGPESPATGLPSGAADHENPPGDAGPGPRLRRGLFEIRDDDRAHWAFQPLKMPTVPSVETNPAVTSAFATDRPVEVAPDARLQPGLPSPIDAFIDQQLVAAGLAANPPATRRELLRRASFDVTGLPPTPQQLDQFEQDGSQRAWEQQVDRLLASPQFGTRWARHWLDLVRFAQSNGYENDEEKPLVWRYRDYVVESFNRDLPYDQFIIEQLAGDQLVPRTNSGVIATGFYRLGVWDAEPDDRQQALYDELDDIISTVGQVFLGLTINCARCHDHKYDPFSQRDYYQFVAHLRNIERFEPARQTVSSTNYVPLAAEAEAEQLRYEIRTRAAELRSVIAALPANDPARTQREKELRGLEDRASPFPLALAIRDRREPPPPMHVLIRGQASQRGVEVQPAFPEIFSAARDSTAEDSNHSQSPAAQAVAAVPQVPERLALARWIASPENPLTARVFVNRVWQHYFGKGLVPTPNDFGLVGLPPTHPELLDWLAADFVEHGWQIKRLHKQILMSAVYQRSSRVDVPESIARDEANRWYWRQSLRRLDAESLRDAILATAGCLNLKAGGRGFFPELSREVIAGGSRPGNRWERSPLDEQCRQSIYCFLKRSMMPPEFELFDYTNTAVPVAERPVTTVAPQALLLLNSEFVRDRVAAFARRVISETGNDLTAVIAKGYELALGRRATSAEVAIARDYLDSLSDRARQPEPLFLSPGVPGALFEGYLRRLEPRDILKGTSAGWTYGRGVWGQGYEHIVSLDPATGPLALRDGVVLRDLEFTAELEPAAGSELTAILWRAVADGDHFSGYELLLLPAEERIELRRHRGQAYVVLDQLPLATAPAGRLHVRVIHHQGQIQVELDSPGLLLSDETKSATAISSRGQLLWTVSDQDPLLLPGSVGFRTWGAALTINRADVHALVVAGDTDTELVSLPAVTVVAPANDRDHPEVIPPPLRLARRAHTPLVGYDRPAADEVHERLVRELCLVLLNLNEFAYIP